MLALLLALLLAAHCFSVRQSAFYKYRGMQNFNVHYDTAICPQPDAPSLVLITGFGVGTFHYDKQFDELSQRFRVFSLDLLGQGKSWPTDREISASDRMSYSIDTWYDQIVEFIEEKVLPQSPSSSSIHIAGNSLGGYLASLVASRNKNHVKSLILLNNTPFWGFNSFQEGRVPILGWDAVLPAPKPILSFASAYFNTLRNPSTVRAMLDLVYSNKRSGYDEGLVSSIINSSGDPHGPEAFSSILFAQKCGLRYAEILSSVRRNGVPVLMLYGADDPWITPWWGVRTKAILGDGCIYVECSNSGHCVHHESPRAANSIMRRFVEEVEAGKDIASVDMAPALGQYHEEGHVVEAATRDRHADGVLDQLSDYIVVKFI